MWTGEAEDVERREAKKRRRAEAKRAKKESREKELRGEGGAGTGTSIAGGSMRRRARRTDAEGEEIELQDLNGSGGAGRPRSPRPPPPRPAGSHPSDASVSSGSTPPPSHHFYSPVLAFFAPFFARLRVAHDAAAVAKAALPPGLPDDVRRGWGIRALMLKGKRERGERREAAIGAAAGGEVDASERRAGFEADGGARLGGEEWEDDDVESLGDSWEESEVPERRRTAAPRSRPTPRATNSYPPPPPSPGINARPPRETGEEEEEPVDWAGRGMDGQWRGWRGAIARWRLADVSKF
jgi:hypothetical protein